jgi:protein required for attachment to host cells
MDQFIIPRLAWVVVCDGVKALFLRNDGNAEKLNLVTLSVDFQPEPAAHDMGSDRPGRVHQSQGDSRSAIETPDMHDAAEAQFLVGVAAQIDHAVQEHKVKKLVLIAPPKALGILRQNLAPASKAVIIHELGKDLARLPIPEIERHLSA